MIDRWKARLRAWLIDLVREAIRIDRKQQEGLNGLEYTNLRANTGTVASVAKPASKPVTDPEPSFEQMQAAAIQKQEKFYAPQPK